ncbi:uncharacterized protein LOC122721271 isoform X2 [Manihot esculenta]|uniref:uncharacterized protein LOC122721271 isoform X2 n=1 Tax=Manihot esculenta TaxID=3983 RepID=UPI001CC6BE7B|nr:uncharacterized protein LOC122721271 isoform X2 [Manihot esculenta]
MQEGLAHILLVGKSVTATRSRIETSIPRKHGPAIAGYESALNKFFEHVLQAFLKHIDFSVIRCAVIASPGFTKDQFHRHLLLEAERRQLRPIIENKSRIVQAQDIKSVISSSRISIASASMVSLTGSMLFPATAPHGSTGSARFSIWSTDTTSSFCYNQRKVLCACMAPLRNIGSDEYRATKFNDSYKSKQLGTVLEPEDDSDVLIEGKNVYKSFGDKDILRGVSFKVFLFTLLSLNTLTSSFGEGSFTENMMISIVFCFSAVLHLNCFFKLAKNQT